jgi:hypothetical protein
MNRRQAIQSIGVAAPLPFFASELFALGREAHAHVQSTDDRERYLFQSLDVRESEILSVATELVIPETDTPGARSARVPEFIDTVLTGWFHEDERRRFLRGIRELDERARTSAGVGFASCESAEQTRILKEMETEALRELTASGAGTRSARRAARSSPEAPFFSVLKWLTLFGYYTSEAGMGEELEFVEFPGSYDGCALLQDPRSR